MGAGMMNANRWAGLDVGKSRGGSLAGLALGHYGLQLRFALHRCLQEVLCKVRKGSLTGVMIVALGLAAAVGLSGCRQTTDPIEPPIIELPCEDENCLDPDCDNFNPPVVEPIVLDAPTFNLDGTIITLNAENAANFRIYYSPRVTEMRTRVVGNEFDLADLELGRGMNHDIHARSLAAVGSTAFRNSNAVTDITFTMPEIEIVRQQLETPSNLRTTPDERPFVIPGVLSWDSCGNANRYEIYLNGVRTGHGSAIPSFSLASMFGQNGPPAGTYRIAVRAIPRNNCEDFTRSELSEEYEHYVENSGPTLPQPLPNPEPSISGNFVSWAPVAGAGSFTVVINGERPNGEDFTRTINNATSPLNLATLTPALPVGTFTVNVQAISLDQEVHLNSDNVLAAGTFVVPQIPLGAPLNLRVDGNMLRWNAFENAKNFTLYIGDTARTDITIPGDATSFDLTQLGLGYGNFDISLRANATPNTDFVSATERTVASGQFSVIHQLPQQVIDFIERFGRGHQPGDPRPSTVTLPRESGGAIINVDFDTNTWGEWVELMITAYIRDREMEKIMTFPTIDHPSRMFPTILTTGGMGNRNDGNTQVARDLRFPDRRIREVDNLILHEFNRQIRYIEDNSFAPARSIASAVIIHEEFFRRGGMSGDNQVHTKPDGQFPLIPHEIIDRAVAFHIRAIRNMHVDLAAYHFAPPSIDNSPDNFHDLHNVWDHLNEDEFNISDRFSNNPEAVNLNGSRHARAFGLYFNANGMGPGGFTEPRLGRCMWRLAREAERAQEDEDIEIEG